MVPGKTTTTHSTPQSISNQLPVFHLTASQYESTTSKRPRFLSPDKSRSSKLSLQWSAFKRRCGSGSLPEDSLGDPTNEGSEAGIYGGRRSFNEKHREEVGDLVGEVNEIVVENLNAPQCWLKPQPDTEQVGNDSATSPVTVLGRIIGASEPGSATSVRCTNFEPSPGAIMRTASYLRWRIYPQVLHFFYPKYNDIVEEENYQKELWYTGKSTVLFGACFLVFNWVLAVTLLPRPWSTWNNVQNYGLGPALSLVLVPLAALDVPRSKRYGFIWQILVFCAIWITASGGIVDMYLCGYYTPDRDCGNRDFISLLYSVTALPVVGLFALGQTRIFTLAGVCLWVSLVVGLILADHVTFIRNMLNLILFQSFILFAHYRRELAERRMYSLRAELRVQFRAKQKAQISERKTMDSKRRFSSYIFHEVRVPLNTALLAVQNIEGAHGFDNKNSEHAVEYMALQSSLNMMSQVLNDVLDFSRMEKGGFSSVSRPFSFHKVMRSIFGPLELDATARKLDLTTNLDLRIDEVAKRAAYDDCDENVEEGEGLVMGDEMRLRQVINNLTSNACKFTSSGGRVTVNTILVYPSSTTQSGLQLFNLSASGSADSSATTANDPTTPPSVTVTHLDATSATYCPKLSTTNILQHEAKTGEDIDGQIVIVRIEICDTGVGIRPVDMAHNRLFSPYIQTEIGRVQAGKGTGLGLSIVRQIVTLSGGRLGVQSQVGVGSKFWVEMPFTIGKITRQTHPEPHRRVNLTLEKILSTPDSYSDSDFKFIPSTQGQPESILRKSPPEVLHISTPILQRTTDPTIEEREVLTLQPIPIPINTSSLPPPFLRPEHRSNTSTSSVGILGSPSSASSSSGGSKALVFENGPLKVLVVDDDNLTRRLMGRMMSRLGCEVSSAENGAIALEMLLGNGETPKLVSEYDITFLDNQMPLLSGLQVVSKLRALGRDDLVIGVTANALLSDQEEYLERGASWVLTKPVSEIDLKRFLILADRKRMGFPLPAVLS